MSTLEVAVLRPVLEKDVTSVLEELLHTLHTSLTASATMNVLQKKNESWQPHGDIRYYLKLPTLEWYASELGVEKGSPFWIQLARAREVAENHLCECHPLVPDPREFERGTTWRDFLQQHLGLWKIGMCIHGLSMPTTKIKDEMNSTPYFYLRPIPIARQGWSDFQSYVSSAGWRAAVVVYLGYPEVWMNVAMMTQSVPLRSSPSALRLVHEFLKFRKGELPFPRATFVRLNVQFIEEDKIFWAKYWAKEKLLPEHDDLALGDLVLEEEDFSWALKDESE